AGLVQLLERHRLLVRGDLEDRVRRGVDDPLPCPLVLLAELLDDLGARRGPVTEHAAAGLIHERIDHVVAEAVRGGRERLRRQHRPPPRPRPARSRTRAARGYPTSAMGNVLGLLGILVFVLCVIGLAAGVTWIVVRLFPATTKN